ncbi:MAG: hypothetical protein Q8L22_26475 [Reyranella sp.]|nr:hypothetical protein [Reyranella sp.]
MRRATLAGGAGLTAMIFVLSVAQPLADAPAVAANADEINRALRGKACTTRMGATFTFGLDGSYAYVGLWESSGAYAISDGTVTVTLDNGLARSFAISRHGKVLYIEETALSCPTLEPMA